MTWQGLKCSLERADISGGYVSFLWAAEKH